MFNVVATQNPLDQFCSPLDVRDHGKTCSRVLVRTRITRRFCVKNVVLKEKNACLELNLV